MEAKYTGRLLVHAGGLTDGGEVTEQRMTLVPGDVHPLGLFTGQFVSEADDGEEVLVTIPRPMGVLEFDTIDDRDQFIDWVWPKRECQEAPGFYDIPDGSTLNVLLERIAWSDA